MAHQKTYRNQPSLLTFRSDRTNHIPIFSSRSLSLTALNPSVPTRLRLFVPFGGRRLPIRWLVRSCGYPLLEGIGRRTPCSVYCPGSLCPISLKESLVVEEMGGELVEFFTRLSSCVQSTDSSSTETRYI
jgi:hypothetical protein